MVEGDAVRGGGRRNENEKHESVRQAAGTREVKLWETEGGGMMEE
jgi:hypothetical protein